MKKIANTRPSYLWIILFLPFFYSCSVAEQVQRSAEYKTKKEIKKKTNKKIEDVINPTEKKKPKEEPKKEPEPKNEASSDIKSNNDPTDQNEPKEPNEKAPDEKFELNNNDFIPGGIVIFEDSLKSEQTGEFPSKWDLKNGTIEIMKMGEHPVIGFRTTGEIFPYLESDNYLPEKFTLEFDCYFHNYGNEGYTVTFPGSTSFRVNAQSIGYDNHALARKEGKPSKGWVHIDLSFNKRALKIYHDGVRLTNVPRLKKRPKYVTFSALAPGRNKGKYPMIKNIRIAEGAVPLYTRLVTDGKFVTNDIHFDYNAATLKPDSKKIIQQIAEMLKEHPEIQLSVEGHTDSDGSEASNLTLSEKRADTVRNALVYEGVAASRLTIKGLGESMSVDSNATEDGKSKNRRVEFVLIK